MKRVRGVNWGLAMQRLLLPVWDLFVVNGSYWLAALLLNGFNALSREYMRILLLRGLYVAFIYLTLFSLFHLYHSLWKYASSDELAQCAGAGAMACGLCFCFDWVLGRLGWMGMQPLNPAVSVIAYLVIVSLCGGARISYRALRRSRRKLHQVLLGNSAGEVPRVMVVGAGDMGNIVLSELRANDYRLGVPVVVADDNRAKQGRTIYGTPIRGGCERIPELAKEYRVDEILLCVPSASQQRRQQLTQLALSSGCTVKTSPSLLEMKKSGATISLGQMRDVELEDLMMRPQVTLDPRVCSYLLGQTVLVTGGGGSIGSELCRQAALYQPGVIVIFDIYENNAYALKHQLDQQYRGNPKVEIRVGSVRDSAALERVFEEFRPTVVFHAAAHKHVPLMEDSPCEAVKNNIFGTLNTAEIALKYEVDRFVLLSTDKAVNPTNVMGATKRVTEFIMQSMAQRVTDRQAGAGEQLRSRFSAVRFGNVLGSSGSVIPLFENQIQAGGPVTVTDPEVTRYFMSIPEAAQLVVQAGGLSQGGEIFVLDMGQPIRILTLAEQLIRLSGLKPYTDIQIVFTGLRPGEKLYEELTLEEENATRQTTENNKIFITFSSSLRPADLDAALDKLRNSCEPESVRAQLKALVPNYRF